MTIEELYNVNEDMFDNSILLYIVNIPDPIVEKSCNDIINGCVIYQYDYYSMPKVLKGLHVSSFKCLRNVRSHDELDKWDIWVV